MTNLTRRFDDALLYASAVHGGHRRKGTSIPYLAHLLGVAGIALELGADEDQAIAALLHDAVEDQGGHGRLQDIENRFGKRVAHIVDCCTDAYTEPKPAWEPRKQAYLASLPGKAADELLVALADKIHNAEAIVADLHDLGEGLWDRFTGKKDGTLWYYRSLSEFYSERMPGTGAKRLERAVATMNQAA